MIRSPVLFLPRSKRIDFNFRSYTWYSIHQYTIHSYLLQNSPSFAEKRLFIWTHLPITQGHSQKLGTVFFKAEINFDRINARLGKNMSGGFPKCMVYQGKSIYKWMMTGDTSHFRKPPNGLANPIPGSKPWLYISL